MCERMRACVGRDASPDVQDSRNHGEKQMLTEVKTHVTPFLEVRQSDTAVLRTSLKELSNFRRAFQTGDERSACFCTASLPPFCHLRHASSM